MRLAREALMKSARLVMVVKHDKTAGSGSVEDGDVPVTEAFGGVIFNNPKVKRLSA